MPVQGVIAERTRAILPVTWDALSGDPRFGDDLLQGAVDLAKESVTGTVIPFGLETTYALIVRDFIAKSAALEMIPAGIDFWMNQPVSESATGTNENHAFVDRAEALRKLGEALLKETREKAGEIAEILGFTRPRSGNRPVSNTTDEDFITPSPLEFPRPYAPSGRT